MSIFIINDKQNLSGRPSESYSLDPKKVGHFIEPDLGLNCISRVISRQQQSSTVRKELGTAYLVNMVFALFHMSSKIVMMHLNNI